MRKHSGKKERLVLMERRNLFCLLDDLFYAHCVRHLQFKLLFHLLHETDFYAGVSFFIVHSWGYDDCLKTSEEMARLPLGFIRQSYNNSISCPESRKCEEPANAIWVNDRFSCGGFTKLI